MNPVRAGIPGSLPRALRRAQLPPVVPAIGGLFGGNTNQMERNNDQRSR
jgi:hypothetical protein